MIHLTAIGYPPGGSSTVHIYTHKQYREDTKQTIHRTTQKLGRVRAVPRLRGYYLSICLTIDEKARKNLSQGILWHKHDEEQTEPNKLKIHSLHKPLLWKHHTLSAQTEKRMCSLRLV